MKPLLKAALVSVDPLGPILKTIVFQYNPATVSRSFTPQTPEDRDPSPFRLKGPPRETFTLELELDAADQLETGDPITRELGLQPVLSALETMIYPKSPLIIANEAMMASGMLEIIPPEVPPTLLVWGLWRTVPVAITQLTINEDEFDSNLNPIRARASVAVRVLNYDDLGLRSPGGALFLAYQAAREVLAGMNSVRNIPNIPKLFAR